MLYFSPGEPFRRRGLCLPELLKPPDVETFFFCSRSRRLPSLDCFLKFGFWHLSDAESLLALGGRGHGVFGGLGAT
jgi:hypothetical protein